MQKKIVKKSEPKQSNQFKTECNTFYCSISWIRIWAGFYMSKSNSIKLKYRKIIEQRSFTSARKLIKLN